MKWPAMTIMHAGCRIFADFSAEIARGATNFPLWSEVEVPLIRRETFARSCPARWL